jgi:hypothetical protein
MRAAATGVCCVAAALSVTCASLDGRADSLQTAHLERLYFGRMIGDTAMVSDSAWQVFAREVLAPALPEGYSAWEATGRWRAPDGSTVQEHSFIVELLHLATPDVERRIVHVIDEYKRRFAQQSVLRVVTSVRATF